METTTALPNDIPVLQKMIVTMQQEIHLLSEQLRLMRAKKYGSSSETWDAVGQGQMSLFADCEETPVDPDKEVEKEVISYRRKKAGRRPLPSNLERVDVVHDISDEEKICACGSMMQRIGEETSEQLEVIPAKAFVTRNIRPKYACQACEGLETQGKVVKIAPPAEQLVPKSMASASLLACILTAKYADALPFYRQEKQFTRIGVDLSRATMCHWTIKIAEKCKPLWDLLQQQARSGSYLQMDETTFQVMKEEGRKNQTKSFLWAIRGGPPDKQIVLFQYHPTRSGQFAKDWLDGFRGYVQTDGYAGYDFLDKTEGIVHLGCMAHAHRKFADICKISGKDARTGLAFTALQKVNRLYSIERGMRKQEVDPEAIKAKREKEARPLLEDLKNWLIVHSTKVPPKSLLGKAIDYTLKQFCRLEIYLAEGYLRIDNNRVENDIRPFVLGRKNWLFAGKPEGAKASATIYSLLETAKANGWEPYAYLTFLFRSLPLAKTQEDWQSLLPTNGPQTATGLTSTAQSQAVP